MKEGYDPSFGARPLQRAIQKNILNPLSVKLLSGELSDEAAIKVNSDGKGIQLHKAKNK